ncbi:unnamed protein product [Paramecium octaurelia]|uniref:Uncharacterized protein n=1 Tax=Paramecium octaurelia TaxID=43137 RepID=A0A8S1V777_PAROT|nr:unnamed protein product [Paramecium octaurelia]
MIISYNLRSIQRVQKITNQSEAEQMYYYNCHQLNTTSAIKLNNNHMRSNVIYICYLTLKNEIFGHAKQYFKHFFQYTVSYI